MRTITQGHAALGHRQAGRRESRRRTCGQSERAAATIVGLGGGRVGSASEGDAAAAVYCHRSEGVTVTDILESHRAGSRIDVQRPVAGIIVDVTIEDDITRASTRADGDVTAHRHVVAEADVGIVRVDARRQCQTGVALDVDRTGRRDHAADGDVSGIDVHRTARRGDYTGGRACKVTTQGRSTRNARREGTTVKSDCTAQGDIAAGYESDPTAAIVIDCHCCVHRDVPGRVQGQAVRTVPVEAVHHRDVTVAAEPGRRSHFHRAEVQLVRQGGGVQVGRSRRAAELVGRKSDGGIRRRADRDIGRVEQERADHTLRRPQIRRTAEAQKAGTGNFREATIATRRTAAGGNRAFKTRRLVAPEDDLAAIAALQRIRLQGRLRTSIGDQRIRHCRVVTLIITTNQNIATTGLAAGIQLRRTRERDLLTHHRDVATLATRVRGV